MTQKGQYEPAGIGKLIEKQFIQCRMMLTKQSFIFYLLLMMFC
jgi:hypothetical protein